MAKVFVSHAGADLALASELHDWLIDQGHDVFLDQDLVHGLDAGEDWEQRLHERLRWADAVVCIVTSDFVKSTWCAAEVGISRSRGSRVLPVIAELGVTYPLLPSTQHTPYASDPVAARQSLAESLRRVDLAGAQGWRDGLNPFPGLRAFDADMRSVFFGRKGETKALATLLRSQSGQADAQVLLVVGPSGCGKSSMVRAALLPLMADEPGWWTLPPLVPGADPVGGLARQLAIAARQLKLDWTVTGTRERLDRDDRALNLLAEELLLATPDPSRRNRLLLFVDQFEELLTQADLSGRTRFSTLLRSALDGPLQVVGTLRPEFLEQLLANEELAGLPVQTFPLRSLQRERLRTVIEEPADRAGITVDRDLVDRLVNDTDSGEALPLLAFTLSQLAEGVERNGHLSSVRYDEIGGVQGALTHQADAALADAEAGGLGRSEVISALLWLVTVDEQDRPTRRRVNREQLPVGVAAALDPFVDRRLVSTDTDNGSVVVQVAHEAFLSAWPPLSEAINASASALRSRREVERSAAEWAAQDRAKSHLWERGRLAAAVDAVGAHLGHTNRLDGLSTPSPAKPPSYRSPRLWRRWSRRVLVTDNVELEPKAREFLAASIRHDRRARRRTTIVLASALVLALATAGIALSQQREAQQQKREALQQQRIATARQLVTQAEAARGTDPRTALLLGMAADHIHSDTQTRVSLFKTLISSEYAGTLAGFTGGVNSVAFTPNGRTVATGSQTEVVLWDVSRPGQPKRLGSPLKGLANATDPVAFSSDGHTMATGSRDYWMILWDVSNPGSPKRLGHPLNSNHQPFSDYSPFSMAFGKNGDTLAISDSPGRVTLWNVSKPGTPQLLSTPLGDARKSSGVLMQLPTVAFAPDGNTLAAVDSGEIEPIVCLWDVSNPSIPRLLGSSPTLAGMAYTKAFTPDLRTLATDTSDANGNSDGVVLWDVSNPSMPKRLAGPLKGTNSPKAATFAPDGHTIAISTYKTVSMWDVSNPRKPKQLDSASEGHTSRVASLAFAPDGLSLVTGSDRNTAVLWNTSGQGQPKSLDIPLTGESNRGHLAALTPDGRTLAIRSNVRDPSTGIDEGPLSFWDVSAPRNPKQLGLPLNSFASRLEDPTFGPGGRTLADSGLVLWDVLEQGQPKERSIPTDPDTMVSVLAFTSDGHTMATGSMATGSENTVTLWDVSNPGQLKQRGTSQQSDAESTRTEMLMSGAFAPDGRTLATGSSDNTVILWDVSNPGSPKRLGHPLKGHGSEVTSVVFTSDGRTLAAGSDDNTVILWDVSDTVHPRPLGSPLTGHTDNVSSIAFAPDRRTLATSDQYTVILWDVSDPSRPTRLISQLTGSRAPVAFAADGRSLTTGGMDTPALLWDLTEFNDFRDHALRRACERMSQGPNPTEWAQYVSGLSYEDTCVN